MIDRGRLRQRSVARAAWALALTLLSDWATAGAIRPNAEPLSLREVLSSAERSFPEFLAAQREIDIATGALTSARGSFDVRWRSRFASDFEGFYQNRQFDSLLDQPTTLWGTRVFAGYRLGVGEFPVYDGKLETNQRGEARAGFEIPLWRDGPTDRRRADIWRAEFGLKAGEAQVEESWLLTRLNATNAYWDWVAAGQQVRIFQSLLKVAIDRDAQLAEQVKRGDAARFDRLDVERAVQQRRAQLIAAERRLQERSLALALFYRDGHNQPVVPEPSRLPAELPRPSERAGDSRASSDSTHVDTTRIDPAVLGASAGVVNTTLDALARRPDLRRLDLRLEQLRVEADLQDNQLDPRVDVQLAASRDFGAGSATRTPTELQGVVVLEVPLQVRTARGRLEVARAQSLQVEHQLQLLRDRIRVDVQDALWSIDQAKRRVSASESEYSLARQLEVGERTRFKSGASNLIFVNLREQQTAEAGVRLVESLVEYHRARARLNAVTARHDAEH